MSDHNISSNINMMDYNDNNTKFKVNNKGYYKEIYDSSGNYTKAFKALYRSGKVKDTNHLKFVYNEKTNRFVNKSKIYKKSATKQKILKKKYKHLDHNDEKRLFKKSFSLTPCSPIVKINQFFSAWTIATPLSKA